MKQRLALLLSIALLLPSSALAGIHRQTERVIQKIIEIGRQDNRTQDHLDTLCHRFGGRPIGSAAYDNAAEWVGHQFRSWGMKVVYEQAGTLPVGFNRGPWFGKMTSPQSMELHFATPSYTAGTRGRVAAPAVLEPESDERFLRMKGRIRGSWILLRPTPKPEPPKDGQKPSYAERRKQREEAGRIRQARLRRLEEAGALGVIESARVPIQAMYNKDLHAWKSWEDLPHLCEILLDENQFSTIQRMVEERRRVELEFDIRNHFKMGPVPYHNVIGVIPGTVYPDEYVIVSGHLDAYDVATGAVDCGNGVTTSMEAARLIMAAGGKPKRTILIGLWSGEEFGLLGSLHWVNAHKEELSRVSVMFNRDGGPTVPTGLRVTPAMKPDIEPLARLVNAINPDFPFELIDRKPSQKPPFPAGSDSSSFAMQGIPTFWLDTDDPKGYDFRYGEIWHTENDLFQKSIKEYQDHTSIATAVLAYGIADLDHLLSREGFYLSDAEAQALMEAKAKERSEQKAKEEA